MSSLNSLLLQWRRAGQLDTSEVPKNELAMILVLLYIRDEAQQAFFKARYPKKPVDCSLQRAILVEFYAHQSFHHDLQITPAVVETVYEKTPEGSPLRKFVVRCWLGGWLKDTDESRSRTPTEFQHDLNAASQERNGAWGDSRPWVCVYQEQVPTFANTGADSQPLVVLNS